VVGVPDCRHREGRPDKKLIEAGRAWAKSLRSVNDDDEDDGSAAILLPEKPAKPLPEIFYVHPDNWVAFEVFDACHTQWRVVVGLGGAFYQGLDYAAVNAVIQALQVKKPRKVFNQVRALEAGALSVLNERQDVPDNATHPR
jgi:hypothetical protein